MRLSGISPTPSQKPPSSQPYATVTPIMRGQVPARSPGKVQEALEEKLEHMIFQKI